MARDRGDLDPRLLVQILAGVGLASLASLAVLIGILAPVPVSTLALCVFFPCVLLAAWLVAGIRVPPIVALLMMPILLVLAPAIAGHVATVQQPLLVDPLAPLACEENETLERTWQRRAMPSDGGGNAIYCRGPRGERQTYLPELTHMAGLTLLFGGNWLLALLVRRRLRGSSSHTH